MSSLFLIGTLFFDENLKRKIIRERHQNFLVELSKLAKGDFNGYLDSTNPECRVCGATDRVFGVEITDLLENLCAKFNCVGVFDIDDGKSEERYFLGCGNKEIVRDHLNEVVTQHYLRRIFSDGDFSSKEEFRTFLAKEASRFV